MVRVPFWWRSEGYAILFVTIHNGTAADGLDAQGTLLPCEGGGTCPQESASPDLPVPATDFFPKHMRQGPELLTPSASLQIFSNKFIQEITHSFGHIHSFTGPQNRPFIFIHSVIFTHSLVRFLNPLPVHHSSIHSLINSSDHSAIHSDIQLFVHLLSLLLTCTLDPSLTFLFTQSLFHCTLDPPLTFLFTQSLFHSSVYSVIYSFVHLVVHSVIHLFSPLFNHPLTH
jgi:hypothetical protein